MMDKATREALEESIRHWKRNVSATRADEASTDADDCALCNKFDPHCDGCPVMEQTGHDDCVGSPYRHANKSLRDWYAVHTDVRRDAFRAAAQQMLDFLISLRPVDAAEAVKSEEVQG